MQHRIPPRYPYPAMVGAFGVEAIGFVLIVATRPPVQYVGWVVLVLAAVAAGWVMLRWTRSGLIIDLTDEGWVVRANGRLMRGLWADVAEVSATDARVRLVPTEGQTVVIESPGGADKQRFATLLADITRHLDRHRAG
ncbi:MAG: hypothetical protein L0G99_07775 [Propionibacteriales bacterium]|nr:hypothetical protein [Propionibacteriales bacterium]